MKIDAHQHFWRYNNVEFGWINDKMSVLKRDFLPDDLFKELQAINFDGSIAVQARQNLNETKWLLDLANSNQFIKGIVGWVELCSPNIDEQLNEFSKNNKLMGVRHVVHDEQDDNFMARKDYQNGISLLEKYNLTYDLLLFPKHLELAADLVNEFPNQKFVLDHISKPLIKDHIHSPWNNSIRKLAQNPNVFCKLSGMVTEASWTSWKTSDFKYYLDIVFECFGTDRLMIGSDWPVCTLTGTYKKTMSLVFEYIKKFNEDVQTNILGENCRKFYLQNKR
jgi:L-fuconolactonase